MIDLLHFFLRIICHLLYCITPYDRKYQISFVFMIRIHFLLKSNVLKNDEKISISPTFYEHLLHAKITKSQKKH